MAKLNWLRELEKWLVDYCPIGVAYGNKLFPTDPIVIINYDILRKFHKELHGRKWDALVVDECHYLKNPEAKRTVEVLGRQGNFPKPGIKAARKLFLTGTPIVNKPVDLYPSLHYLAPDLFPSYWNYVMKYCGAFKAGYGWDFGGASNLDEFRTKLRTSVMIRRLKKDVLTELPSKVRQVIELPINKTSRVIKAEEKKVIEYKRQVQELGGMDVFAAFVEMATIRHETALAKVPQVVQHLEEIITGGQKVVCFAWHRDVIEAIWHSMGITCAVVTGDTSLPRRQKAIDQFQNAPDTRLFIGNIRAAGIAITLTAASRVVFAELDWVPGNMTQAEDRCHRIGQKDSVHVQHLVLEGSIDAYMAKVLVRKQDVIDQALDGKGEKEITNTEAVLNEIFDNY